MLNDITIGKYYPGQSFVHKLDPRTKIIWTFFFMFAVIVINNLLLYIPVMLGLLIIIAASKVPFKTAVGTVKSMSFLILFTFVLNIFFLRTGHVYFKYSMFAVTSDGLYMAVTMSVRIIILVIGASMLMFTTTPLLLTSGIEKLLGPFKRFGLPAHEIAMMMTIALRFIPTLIEETQKIMKAQMSRGADFESKNFMSRAKSMIPLLVPLFVSAFRRADELAIAMESRCYNMGKGKTSMKEIKFGKNDVTAFAIMGVSALVLIILSKLL